VAAPTLRRKSHTVIARREAPCLRADLPAVQDFGGRERFGAQALVASGAAEGG